MCQVLLCLQPMFSFIQNITIVKSDSTSRALKLLIITNGTLSGQYIFPDAYFIRHDQKRYLILLLQDVSKTLNYISERLIRQSKLFLNRAIEFHIQVIIQQITHAEKGFCPIKNFSRNTFVHLLLPKSNANVLLK